MTTVTTNSVYDDNQLLDYTIDSVDDDGDGTVDYKILRDYNADGVLESIKIDWDGDGVYDYAVYISEENGKASFLVDEDNDGIMDASFDYWPGSSGTETVNDGTIKVTYNGDGSLTFAVSDPDGAANDGIAVNILSFSISSDWTDVIIRQINNYHNDIYLYKTGNVAWSSTDESDIEVDEVLTSTSLYSDLNYTIQQLILLLTNTLLDHQEDFLQTISFDVELVNEALVSLINASYEEQMDFLKQVNEANKANKKANSGGIFSDVLTWSGIGTMLLTALFCIGLPSGGVLACTALLCAAGISIALELDGEALIGGLAELLVDMGICDKKDSEMVATVLIVAAIVILTLVAAHAGASGLKTALHTMGPDAVVAMTTRLELLLNLYSTILSLASAFIKYEKSQDMADYYRAMALQSKIQGLLQALDVEQSLVEDYMEQFMNLFQALADAIDSGSIEAFERALKNIADAIINAVYTSNY